MLKKWNEVWMGMAEGDAAQYQVLKGMDEAEFFELFQLYIKKIKETVKSHGQHK